MKKGMKQFGMILISVGLAFTMSCSKDSIDNGSFVSETLPKNDTTQTVISDLVTPYGTYEGEWQLSKYGLTCEGQIVVEEGRILFDVPADYLVPRLAIYDDTQKAQYPEEPIFVNTLYHEYLNTCQVMNWSALGYSLDTWYMQMKNELSGSDDTPAGDHALLIGVKVDDVEYSLSMIGIKEQPTAVYDENTGLWTMAIPIDKVTIINMKTGQQISFAYLDKEAPERSAWLFVFRAKRKI